jgi:FtsP/CotA-like multicopper oxidase with cupredoxin domain
MKRRNFLGLGVGVIGAAAAGSIYYRRHPIFSALRFTTAAQGASLGAGIDTTLNVTSTTSNLGGRPVDVFTYNGLFPGPPISVHAGDSVRIRLNNHLPEPTNLHFHGLHISPGGRADDSFLEVPEGESTIYEFVVPRNHSAGTFWYHPHLHGRVAKQVSMGLAAPFIVRGDLDQIPEVAAAKEHILLLQDFPGAGNGMMFSGMGPHGDSNSDTLVNGESNPTFQIAQNGLLRLRFLNASISRYYRLKIQDHPMYIIASDGGGIPTPEAVDNVTLMPGQRVEVLVRGDRSEGSYQLLSSSGPGAAVRDEDVNDDNAQPIASMVYGEKSERVWNIPSRLVDVPRLSAPSLPMRSFSLAGSDMMGGGSGMIGGGMMGGGMMGGGMMGGFSINGRRFDGKRIDTSVSLDTIEDWEYVNTSGMDHPMHLHTNPFQVLDTEGLPERAWRDMVNVPAHGLARIRVSFKDFIGTTVQHCHILTHEDAGMMATVQMMASDGS